MSWWWQWYSGDVQSLSTALFLVSNGSPSSLLRHHRHVNTFPPSIRLVRNNVELCYSVLSCPLTLPICVFDLRSHLIDGSEPLATHGKWEKTLFIFYPLSLCRIFLYCTSSDSFTAAYCSTYILKFAVKDVSVKTLCRVGFLNIIDCILLIVLDAPYLVVSTSAVVSSLLLRVTPLQLDRLHLSG